MTNLRVLCLSRTRLAGTIPPELGQLTLLEELHLPYELTGDIPSELNQLTNLRRLTANWDELRGCLLPQIVNQLEESWQQFGSVPRCDSMGIQ